jgi:phosphoribosylamine--glycine ligase
MKVLVVGSGGREHALVKALRSSPRKPQVICAPGNAGIARDSLTADIAAGDREGIERLVAYARDASVDLTVVGPETPLVLGIANRFAAEGLKVFGPDAAAAQLEGSKCFTKEFLARHRIPTAPFRTFADAEAAERHLDAVTFPAVIKADGLAAGKGVVVARDRVEAASTVRSMLVEGCFGDASRRLVIEDCLRGSELSLMILTDGESFVPLETAQDYKQLLDGDQGPNTGGMGSYSPYFRLDDPVLGQVFANIVRPTLRGFREDGLRFRGVLYVGLMLTASGPQVLEFNVRFGDPEAQAILSRLRSDFLELLERTIEGRLADLQLAWDPRHSVCVVAASGGYPGKHATGHRISGLEQVTDPDVTVFHAGTARGPESEVVTSGGRVLGVTALAADREGARAKAYAALSRIRFEGIQYRKDIGAGGR